MIARSIRLRFMILASVTLALALGCASFAIFAVFERQIKLRVGEELESYWNEVASVFSIDTQGKPVFNHDLADPRYRLPYGGLYWQVSSAEGPILRSRSLWDAQIASPETLKTRVGGQVDEVDGPDNRPLYLLSRTVKLGVKQQETSFNISVAVERSSVDDMRASFRGDVWMSMGLIAVALLAASWIQLGVGLKPLSKLRAELDRIRNGRAERLRGPFVRELEPLANDLNRLLDRQDGLIGKARDRAGTLAHGLKTPMTIIAAEARKLDRLDLRETADTLREQIRLMNAHVQRELSRSRTRGLSIGGGHITDIDKTVTRLIGLCRRMPNGASLEWKHHIPAGLAIRMEADDFGEVLGNLLDNARKWAESTVEVRATITGNIARFDVIDDGPGFADHILPIATERGVRGSENTENSGLGLSIVRDVLAEYDGGFEIRASRGSKTIVSFTLEGWLDAPTGQPTPMTMVRDPAPGSGPVKAQAPVDLRPA